MTTCNHPRLYLSFTISPQTNDMKKMSKQDIRISLQTMQKITFDNMFTADSICEMIEFLIDNIFVQFGGRLFRQVIGIPMGTNCAPLLADLFPLLI